MDRPVFFNRYPNFSVDLNDPLILDTLTLQTQNQDFSTLGKGLVSMGKIYYKLMATNVSPKALLRHSPPQRNITVGSEYPKI